MIRICNLLLIAVLSCTALTASADNSNSPFSCQVQAEMNQLNMGTRLVQPYVCPENSVPFIQLSSEENAAFCMNSAAKPEERAPNSVCEVNPEDWVQYSSDRQVCSSKDPQDCELIVY